jgi:hypothetical protein
MRNLFLILVITLLYGCVYDPPHGLLTVHNYSDSAVYVYLTCADSLQLTPKLNLFEYDLSNSTNARGQKRDPIYSPNYRVNAYSYSEFAVWGTAKKPRSYCEDKSLRLFFIKENTIRTKKWEEIYKKQLYVKKVILTEKQLNDGDWEFTYYP